MLVLNLPAYENKKYSADVSMETVRIKKEPIKTLGFTLPMGNSARIFLKKDNFKKPSVSAP